MQKYYYFKYKNHFGKFGAVFRNKTILMLFLPGISEDILSLRLKKAGITKNIITNKQACHEQFTKEFNKYFTGSTSRFKTNYELTGTPFQIKVWDTISKIPYGRTATYGDVAYEIGNPKALRAVGAACGANPLPVIVPCHRVTGKNSLGGFTGGISLKEQLLRLESRALSQVFHKARQNCRLT